LFDKILIANRGEIACRVMRTARRMGMATVAVYSEADAGSRHVEMADESVLIGPAPSAQSYLLAERILAAVKDTGAQAVHPGFGFLSENADFARALEAEGIVFIGPGPDAISAMGDKIESKKLAAEAGVSTIPGHDQAIVDVDAGVAIATKIGYPVMVKASAGGGGKGMRVVDRAEDLAEAFSSAQNEGRNSFGDDRMLIEKFITSPRHIEIQLMADAHGNAVYLNERECSIQRRHQKVIEEAPSPFVDAGMRRAMGEQAVALAKAVGYRSAGTVEFVTGADKNFYFLEMNTRLQVEHPVTEMITGLDLVEMMIRVAAGEPLGITQDDVALDGWAVESRIYAEDPARGFLPSIGRLVRFLTPEETNSVRIDTGVGEGDEISMHYDPMIAKLVTYGPDRAAAIARMGEALDGFLIGGINTNVPFLASICRNDCFGKGTLTTNFIAEEYGGVYAADTPDDTVAEVLAGVAALIEGRVAARAAALGGEPDGTRQDLTISVGESEWQVGVTLVESGCDVKIDSKTLAVRDDGWRPGDSVFRGRIGERDVVVQVARGAREAWRLVHGGAAVDVLVRSARAATMAARMPKKEPPDLSKFLLSPMPGLVVSVAVTAGDMVKAGEPLCVVDAMKMENVLRAEREVTVAEVKASTGDSLEVDQVIMIFE